MAMATKWLLFVALIILGLVYVIKGEYMQLATVMCNAVYYSAVCTVNINMAYVLSST